MIPVTKPYIPDISKYQQYVASILKREWLTNNGPNVLEFEQRLRDYLDIENLLFVTNGTIALQIAIKALELEGEVITTAFSYIATTSSLVWEDCQPVFVDIDPRSLNIDPSKIEAAITNKTTAILATHCFGNACEIDEIQKIADKFDLKVIYDAAHCFGTKYKGKSIFQFGDITITSLHATKLMHSIEGGIVFCSDRKVLDKVSFMRNFGHDGYEAFNGVGINGKNSEFHAAMGICVLDDIEAILERRASQSKMYEELLQSFEFGSQKITNDCEFNHAYYPIILKDEEQLLRVKSELEKNEIYPRRYFYPPLNKLQYVNSATCEIAESISSRILCLPLYHSLKIEEIKSIIDLIHASINTSSKTIEEI